MIVPQHVAIIMDGNGRWAQLRGLPRSIGHVKGTRVAKKIITACSRRHVKSLTLYAFSTENWLRPEEEVTLLMKILRRYLLRETENLVKENIHFSIIGDLSRLPQDVVVAIEQAAQATSHCNGLHLVFALSYGSRQEITSTVRELAERVQRGELNAQDIDEAMINANLSTAPVPDPDLIIRTSGEKRLSNFLMWQAAYSEFYFTDILWPRFTEADLDEAFRVFATRQRRFGKISATTELDEKLHH